MSRRPDLLGIFILGSSRARKNQISGKEFELISFPVFPLFARILFLHFLEFFEFCSCNYFRATDGVSRGHPIFRASLLEGDAQHGPMVKDSRTVFLYFDFFSDLSFPPLAKLGSNSDGHSEVTLIHLWWKLWWITAWTLTPLSHVVPAPTKPIKWGFAPFFRFVGSRTTCADVIRVQAEIYQSFHQRWIRVTSEFASGGTAKSEKIIRVSEFCYLSHAWN